MSGRRIEPGAKPAAGSTDDRRKIRVLHVLWDLTLGGIESWLLEVIRRRDSDRFDMDVLCYRSPPGLLAPEIAAAGGAVISGKWRSFSRRSDEEIIARLGQRAPYDVLHSHFHPVGCPLRWGVRLGIPVRIVQAHNSVAESSRQRLYKRPFVAFAAKRLLRHATHRLAVSSEAGRRTFGSSWREGALMRCGIDLTAFRGGDRLTEGTALRRQLGLSPTDVVVGQVGRFFKQKNQEFTVSLLPELLRREPRAKVVFVGDGSLRDHVLGLAAKLGVAQACFFTGVRRDVPRLMTSVFDVLLLPSLWEGLPLVGLEAQAAGLPIVVSTCVTEEMIVASSLVQRLPLTAPEAAWAEAALRGVSERQRVDPNAAYALLEGSDFSICRSVTSVQDFYVRACRENAHKLVGVVGTARSSR